MAAVILALLEEDHNSKQVKTCLADCGHELFVVSTFAEALAPITFQKFNLIISDVHLENGGSVFDFLRFVKQYKRTRDIPFILFSLRPMPLARYLADSIRTTARYLGAVMYIQMETFDAVQFQEHIHSWLSPENKLLMRMKTQGLIEKVGE